MSLLDIYLSHKEDLERRIQEAYTDFLDAGPLSIGQFKILIRNHEKQLVDADKRIAELINPGLIKHEQAEGVPKIVKIFLASSSELKQDRDQFEIFIARESNNLISQNIFLRLILWEDFIDSVSSTRLQNEYNEAIKNCDIFVSLFHTKSGIYSEEEFDVALEKFKTSGKPKVYTYFKNNNRDQEQPLDPSLNSFKDKLRAAGHFPTSYENIYDLKYQFKMQLDKMQLKDL